MFELPPSLLESRWGERLRVAVDAVTSAGAALNALRGNDVRASEVGSQLKTAIDLAAEGWVLGLLEGSFPEDRFLAEERYAATGVWMPDESAFWTVDALDGTRSYIEGFPGFCVQVAFIERGRPVLGVVAEPVSRRCYAAAEGHGAYELGGGGTAQAVVTRLEPRDCQVWPERPRFVDSRPPEGVVGQLLRERSGCFVECGSIGLKACRVAADLADVYAKRFRFRIWDVAPAQVILAETGCGLRLWQGGELDYSGSVIEFDDLLAAPSALLEPLLQRLSVA